MATRFVNFYYPLILRQVVYGLISLAVVIGCYDTQATAMQPMDSETVKKALAYGMVQKDLGYATLLGYNWQDGPEGMLLNVYTPFMQLASKTYNQNFPLRPTEQDIETAKKKNRRLVYFLLDPKGKQEVKFSLSFYGTTPDFAIHTRAWIEGLGRGRTFIIKPAREIRVRQPLPMEGTDVTQQAAKQPVQYEAVNAYYFSFAEMLNLDTFTFYVQQGETEPVTFRLDNKKLL